MKVYIAVLQQNNYETEPWNLGVYETKEKAEHAILLHLRSTDPYAPLLSLETYDAQDEPYWLHNIEEFEVE